MPLTRRRLGWWSPDPRGVLPLGALRLSRSLRRSLRRYRVTVDQAFHDVVSTCASEPRPHGWISREFVAAYTRLHALGLAHSVEAWSPDGTLVGGLYGVSIGGFFAGESMFHRQADASKVCLVHLVERLATSGQRSLLDVQWSTPHLASLGVIELERTRYLDLLADAIDAPAPEW